MDYGALSKSELIERLRAMETKWASADVQVTEQTNERQRSQAALRDQEERLRAILNTAVEGIITIDEQGIIESFNPAAERIFGYKSGEVVGRNVSLLMPMPDRRNHDGYLANYAKTGNAQIIGIGREVVGRRKDGTVFPMDLSVSEVRLEDRRLFTGFVRDITERKRLEHEILEVSERERRSIGQGLHDGLCQHLAGIELMSQVLEQSLARKSKADANQAAKIAEHVREAIVQTRMLARGLSPVSLESNGLMSALQEMAASISRIFNVDCRFEPSESIPVADNGVATHLYRITQEAINNSLKHGHATVVTIGLRGHGPTKHLTVTDNGRGISAEATQGGGMGLQIMKYRAGMIRGSLTLESARGKGTTVTCIFKLPA